jgi:hypothetical protein|tara:strand:- start:230 stop:457 length:228 start_codon:yes stop_codon:yes gene_type:complete
MHWKRSYTASITNGYSTGNEQMGIYPRATGSTARRIALNTYTINLAKSKIPSASQKNASPLSGLRFTHSMGVDHR